MNRIHKPRNDNKVKSLSSLLHGITAAPVPAATCLMSTVLDVVLFGVGDYRVADHVGLFQSLHPPPPSSSSCLPSSPWSSSCSKSKNVILPLTILDTVDTLSHIPMSITHPYETASLLYASLSNLNHQLHSQFHMNLHVAHSHSFLNHDLSTMDSSSSLTHLDKVMMSHHTFVYLLQQTLQTAVDKIESLSSSSSSERTTLCLIRLHVCDLGLPDTAMRYNPYSILQDEDNFKTLFLTNKNNNSLPIHLCPWTCTLHTDAWEQLLNNHTSFPNQYDTYETLFLSTFNASRVEIYTNNNNSNNNCTTPTSLTIPNLQFSNHNLNLFTNIFIEQSRQVNTHHHHHPSSPSGLYMTHWGGLNIPQTMNETLIQDTVHDFLLRETQQQQKRNQDGDSILLSNFYDSSYIQRNNRSLEHASIERLLINKQEHGRQDANNINNNIINTDNLIQGEVFTRFLAAPLFFGLISLRQIWVMAQESSRRKSPNYDSSFSLPNIQTKAIQLVKKFCLDREWHTLLATKQLLIGENVYYWRWHGFLCRYSLKSIPLLKSILPIHNDDNSDDTNHSPSRKRNHALVMIHGFGASGVQFNQTSNSLAKNLDLLLQNENNNTIISEQTTLLVAAPDLIGFGHSEKPSLTYTQYLWESYVTSFTQEIILNPRKGACEKYILGGNSIGGYTAMACAADDSTLVDVTSSGANGSGKCKGLILMNSAGRIYSRDELQNKNQAAVSITEATALNMLGPPSPLPRWIASLGGQLLLSFLRPRIQSICINLYPTNPAVVKDSPLCSNILRDSLDPGALNVMISGTKLPVPRTANELLGSDFGSVKNRQYETVNLPMPLKQGMFEGPVLIAQGILDPLNDAKGRARMFRNLRSGIDVEEVNGGHCPHDEMPNEISNAIIKWIISQDPFDIMNPI